MSEVVVPHTIRGEEATPQVLADIDDNFKALCRAIGALGSGGGFSVQGTPTPGAIIIQSATGVWTVLAAGANGQYLRVVAGLPDWEGMGLTAGVFGGATSIPVITIGADGSIASVTSIAATAVTHNLLSGTHLDTTSAAPLLGDLIVGEQNVSGVTDDALYWADGEASHGLSTTNDPGGLTYWVDGGSMIELIAATALGPVTWRRLARGTENQVVTMRSGRPGWFASSAATGAGAGVYASANFTAVWGALTTVTFNTVERDDNSYFSAVTPTRLTAPADGWYSIVGTVTADYASFGLLWVMLYVNGVLRRSHHGGMTNVSVGWGGSYEPRQVVGDLYLTAGQYVELKLVASKTSMANATMIGGAAFCNLSIVKVG